MVKTAATHSKMFKEVWFLPFTWKCYLKVIKNRVGGRKVGTTFGKCPKESSFFLGRLPYCLSIILPFTFKVKKFTELHYVICSWSVIPPCLHCMLSYTDIQCSDIVFLISSFSKVVTEGAMLLLLAGRVASMEVMLVLPVWPEWR